MVDPVFAGPKINVKFSRVLIDNGSSINIMYKDTMEKLGITKTMLTSTGTTFHGIVPGLSCTPKGKIWLDVLFGGKETAVVNAWCLRLLTSRARIMPYSAELPWPSSWPQLMCPTSR